MNAEREIPDFNFSQVHEAARSEWNELLSRFDISADTSRKADVTLFYSSVSYTMMKSERLETLFLTRSVVVSLTHCSS